MSLQAKILSLLSGITDPAIRIDVASTINYLFDVYCNRSADENEIKDALFDICVTIIGAKHPELTMDECRSKAEILVDEIMKSFRVESIKRRIGTRFRRLLY